MKRLHLFLSLFISLLYAASALSQSDISGSIRSIARAWLLSNPEGTDTIAAGQFGLGWRDGRCTLQTPAGNWQFYQTGSPLQSVVYWPGRLEADVVSSNLFLGSINASQVSGGNFNPELMRLSMIAPLANYVDNVLNAGQSGITYTATGVFQAMEPAAGRYFPVIDAVDADTNFLSGAIRTASQLRTDLSIAHLVSPPATATSTGTVNQIAFDSAFFYVCTATNTWRRAALNTW